MYINTDNTNINDMFINELENILIKVHTENFEISNALFLFFDKEELLRLI